ncbi:MAG: tail fiber protein [Anaerolineae bacterium]
MSTPYLSEIKIVSFTFAPKGWALCNGQLLPINQNQALFSLLGTTYGGDGRVNFALPNLQGRVPMHLGNGHTQGEIGGETAHTVNISELPQHTHTPVGSSNNASAPAPTSNVWATLSSGGYSPTANTTLNPASITNTGGSQPHDNMSPYLVLNFCIALQGIFPSRN